jgi:hypothetical protein
MLTLKLGGVSPSLISRAPQYNPAASRMQGQDFASAPNFPAL